MYSEKNKIVSVQTNVLENDNFMFRQNYFFLTVELVKKKLNADLYEA